MASEAIDICEPEPRAAENASDGGRYMLFGERRDRPVKNHAETLRVDIPAHDVERVGPGVLTADFDRRDARFAGPQHAGGGAVAEEGGGDDIRLGQFVEPESQRAYFDGDQQHNRAGARFI